MAEYKTVHGSVGFIDEFQVNGATAVRLRVNVVNSESDASFSVTIWPELYALLDIKKDDFVTAKGTYEFKDKQYHNLTAYQVHVDRPIQAPQREDNKGNRGRGKVEF